MKITPYTVLFFCASTLAPSFARADTDLAANKALVQKFYDEAFNRHHPREAALAYLSESYIQHNPFVGTGRAAFIEAFASATRDDPSHTEFKRLIAENDLVVLHSFKTAKPGDRGAAGIDIFRVKDGKITEHWDVNQKIPEGTPKNTNTMF